MAIFNKPVKYTREQLLDHYSTSNSSLLLLLKYLYGVIRFIGIIIENLYCVSSYLVLSWIILLPINWLKSDLYSRLENYLYNSLLFIVSSWSLAAGTTIVESGDDYKHLIEEPEKYCIDDDHQEHRQQKRNRGKNGLKTKGHNKRHIDSNQEYSCQNAKTCAINATFDANVGAHSQNLLKGETNRATNNLSALTNGKYRGLSNGHQINSSNHTTKARNMLVGSAAHQAPTPADNETMSASECERIEYQVELASAAGERKLVHHSYRTSLNGVNNDTLLSSDNPEQSQRKSAHGQLNDESVVQNSDDGQTQHQHVPITSTLNATLSASTSSLKNMQAKPRILFLCNHISTADVPLIMQSFSTLTNQSLLWVMDAQFKPTNFGVVSCSHGDFFVEKNTFVDGSLREQVLKYPDRNMLVLFPEGGFLRKRIEGSNRYAIRNNYPLTKYVTHPRFGAFKDLIDPSVGVTHIVDATLLYEDIKNPLSILDIALGTRREPAILNYKLYKRSEITPNEEWLRNIWLEKDKLMANYYQDRNGFLRCIENTLRMAQLDWFKVLAVHLFYLLVCYLAIFRVFNYTSITMLKARELYYSNM